MAEKLKEENLCKPKYWINKEWQWYRSDTGDNREENWRVHKPLIYEGRSHKFIGNKKQIGATKDNIRNKKLRLASTISEIQEGTGK